MKLSVMTTDQKSILRTETLQEERNRYLSGGYLPPIEQLLIDAEEAFNKRKRLVVNSAGADKNIINATREQ